MSLKQEIETWVDAIARYDNNEFDEALKTFGQIADTSKILFNCGVIHATLGEHDKAVECYQRATACDQYLAVAYFQQGVSNFLVGDFEEALANFNDTLLYLRGNTFIDYDQLGLKFKLYSCEVLFNRGLCYIYLQQTQAGMGDLSYASKEKVTPDHDVIDEAIREEAQGYTVFSIPVGVVYRPNPAKVKNLKSKDYLGKARLVASSDKGNMFTGFQGAERAAIVQVDNSKDDRPVDSISYAASNLVRADLSSRSVRQQSAPPINRNMFPPTPPPETEQMSRRQGDSSRGTRGSGGYPSTQGPGMTARANSVRDGTGAGARPNPYGAAPQRRPTDVTSPKPDAVYNPYRDDAPRQESYYPPPQQTTQREQMSSDNQRSRVGTIRTASEPRGPVSKYSTSGRSYRDGPPSSNRRLFMEATPIRGTPGEEAEIDQFPEELYDLYRNTATSNPYGSPVGGSNSSSSNVRRNGSNNSSGGGGGGQAAAGQPQRQFSFGPERDSRGSSLGELDEFEMLGDGRGLVSSSSTSGPSSQRGDPHSRSRSNAGGSGSGSGSYGNGSSSSNSNNNRPVDIRTVRVKMHCGDDTRYLMVGTGVAFDDFLSRVRDKLRLKAGAFRVRVRDEGDMITLGDPDDWDLAVQTARTAARKGGEDMARIEVWVNEI